MESIQGTMDLRDIYKKTVAINNKALDRIKEIIQENQEDDSKVIQNQEMIEIVARYCYQLILTKNDKKNSNIGQSVVSYADLKKIARYYIYKYGNDIETEKYITKVLKSSRETLKYCYDLLNNCYYSYEKIMIILSNDKVKLKKYLINSLEYSALILKREPEEEVKRISNYHDVRKGERALEWINSVSNIIFEEDAIFENLFSSFSAFKSCTCLPKVMAIAELRVNQVLCKNEILSNIDSHEVAIEKEKKLDEFLTRLKEVAGIYFRKQREEKQEIKNQILEAEKLEKMKIALPLIKEFIAVSDKKSVKDFCRDKKIDFYDFKQYLKILEEKNPDLYREYSEVTKIANAKRYHILVEKTKKIINMIINGVVEQERIREFNIVDYYAITKLDFDELEKIASDFCSKDEMKYLKDFIRKNSNLQQLNLQNELNTKQIIKGREITDLEKHKAFEYMKRKKFPYFRKVYSIIIKNYVDGKIDLFTVSDYSDSLIEDELPKKKLLKQI